MEEILAALSEQQAELDGLVNPVDDTAWAMPSRCEGWSVSDVVLHLAQTNEMALASLQHRMQPFLEAMLRDLQFTSTTVDDGAGAMVDKERGAPPAEVYARWRDGVDEMMTAYRVADPHDRVQWVAGTLSAHTLATTRLAESWIHTNDVAFGLGVDLGSPDRLKHIARLAWRTLPYAFTRAGRDVEGRGLLRARRHRRASRGCSATSQPTRCCGGRRATCARSPASAPTQRTRP